jgi:glycerophosphoryl diester phosphodiesterase
MTRPLVIAHRGASHGEVDNSIEAFTKAIDVGADMIEFDVRRTRDDQLICFHDADIRGRAIATLTRDDIADTTGHVPPLLDDILDLANGHVGLDIELKEGGYVERVMTSVAQHFKTDRLIVTSFLDEVVLEVKHLRPDVRTGLLVGRDKPKPFLRTRLSEVFPVRRARACGADAVAMHFKLADLGALGRAHDAGLDVFVWTVNEDEQIRKYSRDERVAALITDVPERALDLRG